MFEILNLKNNPENNPKILKIIFEIFAKNWFPLIKQHVLSQVLIIVQSEKKLTENMILKSQKK